MGRRDGGGGSQALLWNSQLLKRFQVPAAPPVKTTAGLIIKRN
jgi:hypothetical protein